MKLSVVIPTYNGHDLLEQNLPAVTATKPDEIIVVDDASTDDTISFLATKFPQIKLVKLTRNRGFARAVNAGVSAATGDVIVLFNSDTSPHPDCLSGLTHQFSTHSNLFSVGFLETDPRTGLKRGKSRGFWKHGLVHHAQAGDLKPGPTFWTFAAAATYRKSMWDKLAGLDPLFRPAYWEDIDLSYRAQKQGWQVLFDPQREVTHPAESTMKAILGSRVTRLSFKNQLLFTWKNMTSIKLLLSHLMWLPYHILLNPPGFLLASLQLPEVLIARFKQLPPTISDEALLHSFTSR